ncbi:hypothetical protein GGR57DRAFT_177321 [Xylariaceae sp. FL1272]|nr:hypothetical protein GGR57DRAFT_177321 [Xylariaceae sp. FL1272]
MGYQGPRPAARASSLAAKTPDSSVPMFFDMEYVQLALSSPFCTVQCCGEGYPARLITITMMKDDSLRSTWWLASSCPLGRALETKFKGAGDEGSWATVKRTEGDAIGFTPPSFVSFQVLATPRTFGRVVNLGVASARPCMGHLRKAILSETTPGYYLVDLGKPVDPPGNNQDSSSFEIRDVFNGRVSDNSQEALKGAKQPATLDQYLRRCSRRCDMQ